MSAPRYAVNCSIMLSDRSVAERLATVHEAGFRAVEFWWPFASATPNDADVNRFVDDVQASGLQLVGLNLFAGDMPAGDRGVISWPGRESELRASVQIAVGIGQALGCHVFNALYGNRLPGEDSSAQDALAVENLAHAAEELARIGGTVVVEPVSGVDAYPLKTASDAVRVVDRARNESGAANVGLLCDVYHLATNGDDVGAALARYRDRIAHVQVADAPGRGAPGTGRLPLATWVTDLAAGGYSGYVAFEYRSDDADPFDWIKGRGIDDPFDVRGSAGGPRASDEGSAP